MSLDLNITKDDIATWLTTHPEFFQEYAELLAEIQVPHPHADQSIPLIERQLLLLRDKNRQLANHMRDLLRYGQKNDIIIERMQRLAVDLMRAEDAKTVLKQFYAHIHIDFGISAAEIRLISKKAAQLVPDIYLASPVAEIERMGDKAYCGSYASDLVLSWFRDAHRLKSFARVALRDSRGKIFGVMALGSDDGKHFSADMATHLLSNIAELLAAAFERTLKQAQNAD